MERMHVSRQVLSLTKAKHLTNYSLTADGLTTFPGALRDEQVQHLFFDFPFVQQSLVVSVWRTVVSISRDEKCMIPKHLQYGGTVQFL